MSFERKSTSDTVELTASERSGDNLSVRNMFATDEANTDVEQMSLYPDEAEESDNRISKRVQVVRFPIGGNLLWFDYPVFINKNREVLEKTELIDPPTWKTPAAPLTWSSKWDRFALTAVLQKAGLHKVSYDDNFLRNKTCSIVWGSHPKNNAKLFYQLQAHQRFNHIPGSRNITRKDMFASLFSDLRKKKNREKFNFIPETYIWPDNQKEICKYLGIKKTSESSFPGCDDKKKKSGVVAVNKRHSLQRLERNSIPRQDREYWIIKYAAATKRGDIRIVEKNDLYETLRRCSTDVSKLIVQRYISNPLLIDNRKFKLRCYVLVTSFFPLRLYFFPEGVIDFCEEKFSFVSSLGGSATFKRNGNKKDPKLGHIPGLKGPNHDPQHDIWTFANLKENLGEVQYQQVMKLIKDNIVKTFVASTRAIHKEKHILGEKFEAKSRFCFELFGVDVLIDENFKGWITEVNLSPSLASPTDDIKIMKTKMLCDIFYLVGVPYKNENRKDQHKSLNLAPKKEKKKGMVKTLRQTISRGREKSRQIKYASWSTNNNTSKSTFFGAAGGETLEFEELCPEEREAVALGCEEFMRRGNFERLVPPMPNNKIDSDYITLLPKELQYLNCLVKDFEAEVFDLLFDKNIHDQ